VLSRFLILDGEPLKQMVGASMTFAKSALQQLFDLETITQA
jgi:hypothetical protein